MDTQVIIPLDDFPENGLHLSGEADGALFELDGPDVQSVGPLHYELDAQLYDTELLVRGRISAPFRFRCVRCLNTFEHSVDISDLTLSYDTRGKESLNITEDLREEVLLALPAYPKCELSGTECRINDTFGDFRLDKDPEPGVHSVTPSGKSVWDALDRLSES